MHPSMKGKTRMSIQIESQQAIERRRSGTYTIRGIGLSIPLVLLLCMLSACGSVQGSGNLRTETRSVSGFTAVDLSEQGHLVIEQNGTEGLTITAEDNILPLLTSNVSGDRLVLGTKPLTI